MLSLAEPGLFRSQSYIDGAWVDAHDGATLDVRNPATGELLGTVPDIGAEQTRNAISAAHAAFRTWRRETAETRAGLLKRWFELMIRHQEDLALLMTCEQGKPLAEARGEIAYAASYVEWFAEEARRVYGDLVPSPWQDRQLLVHKEPVGVCAAITPWNFPSAMIARKVAPALAAGCTIIVKPATQTPLSALALAALAEQAGIPRGVFSVITGEPLPIGGELTANPLVRKLTFTGSTQTGRLLAAQCAPTLKKLSLELGGNAPFIVFDDADLDRAVAGAIASKYRNSGQTCVCANRFYVQDGIYDAFARRLAEAAAALPVGNGLEAGVALGPLIDGAALDKVDGLVADALSKGARALTGGRPHALGRTFYEPTVLTDVVPGMRLAREEIFGPVAPLFRFHDEDEVIAMANDSEYGLASYFYARDLSRVWRVAAALEFGMVGVNTGIISTAVAPFGGVKQTGMGREGSRYGIEDYLQTKYVCLDVT